MSVTLRCQNKAIIRNIEYIPKSENTNSHKDFNIPAFVILENTTWYVSLDAANMIASSAGFLQLLQIDIVLALCYFLCVWHLYN